MIAHVQTKTEIRAALDSLGIRPQRRFGQHFLIDGNLMRRLADCAEIGERDTILEVGGGTGGLTDLLAARAAKVIVAEIDHALAGLLRDRFADRQHVCLIEADALAGKNRIAPAVIDAVIELAAAPPDRTALVANLPYAVATPLLMNLLHELPVVERFCFTIQRDVAERIQAAPGTKAYGPLSVTLQTLTDIHRVARVSPSAFWPPPTVESSMLRIDVRHDVLPGPEPIARFVAFVREAFLHRRKMLKHTLSRILDERAFAAAADLLDLTRRPEDLPPPEWLDLARRTVLTD
ncbi:MAG TPA: 16S rRNA (adenine(1518)-N(6)/adenine(1519)-N(6))-dimethyltransferase RsmA [Phycisphaerae bacterium]|nr:16S rRNA (adenine(1518)-N(6)/adenine(1519)-N(6))-dimethyltransferase RsmA [Phycisphaerae bacterium]